MGEERRGVGQTRANWVAAVHRAEPLREQWKHLLFFQLLRIQPHLCLLSHHSATSRHHLLDPVVCEQVLFSTLLVDFKCLLDRFGRKTAFINFPCFTLGKETQPSCAWPFLLWLRKRTQELLLQHGWEDLSAVGRWVMPEGSDASQTLLHAEETGWLLL